MLRMLRCVFASLCIDFCRLHPSQLQVITHLKLSFASIGAGSQCFLSQILLLAAGGRILLMYP